MTPAGLANTIAAAREGQHEHLYRSLDDFWVSCDTCQALAAIRTAGFTPDEAGIRAAERYLALWQALEWRHMYLNGVLPPPFGHDCHWCGDCCGKFADAERQALAQAAEKLQEALND